MTPTNPPSVAITRRQAANLPRTLRLALLAFGVGLFGVAFGGSNLIFLWMAYQHGGL